MMFGYCFILIDLHIDEKQINSCIIHQSLPEFTESNLMSTYKNMVKCFTCFCLSINSIGFYQIHLSTPLSDDLNIKFRYCYIKIDQQIGENQLNSP
jgi:hypothetical protein